MTTIEEYRQAGRDLEEMLMLRTSPLAVKLLRSEADIPEGAVRPSRDRGEHLAQCQAFALSRREKLTVAMLEEDNWCFAPVIAYGLEDRPDNEQYAFFTEFPRFATGTYCGIVSAPLRDTAFEPDVVIVYSNTAQLRNLLQPLHFARRAGEVTCNFFPPACSYLVVTVMETGNFVVALPDPGEVMRALSGEDEIIVSFPAAKLEGTVNGLKQLDERHSGYRHSPLFMKGDFEQPELYKVFFRQWGLVEDD
jgi:uncharacterized protein (DUF169 family)